MLFFFGGDEPAPNHMFFRSKTYYTLISEQYLGGKVAKKSHEFMSHRRHGTDEMDISIDSRHAAFGHSVWRTNGRIIWRMTLKCSTLRIYSHLQ